MTLVPGSPEAWAGRLDQCHSGILINPRQTVAASVHFHCSARIDSTVPEKGDFQELCQELGTRWSNT